MTHNQLYKEAIERAKDLCWTYDRYSEFYDLIEAIECVECLNLYKPEETFDDDDVIQSHSSMEVYVDELMNSKNKNFRIYTILKSHINNYE